MATVTTYLWTKSGQLSLPGKTIPFWGYALDSQNNPQVPGPLIEAETGDRIHIGLLNSYRNSSPIGERTSIMFPGQTRVKVRPLPGGGTRDVRPQYLGGELISFTDYVELDGYSQLRGLLYSFEATRPGIFLYESGTHPEVQVQMGLYGAIVVKPRGYNNPHRRDYHTAYGANTGSFYDVEKILILGELDSALHETVANGEEPNLLALKPDFWTINGRSYPDTLVDSLSPSQPFDSEINCHIGQRVLLRIVNAGFQTHTLALGGLVGKVIAENSDPLVTLGNDISYAKTHITLGAGHSADVILQPNTPGDYHLYDRDLNHTTNYGEFPGGMITRLEVKSR